MLDYYSRENTRQGPGSALDTHGYSKSQALTLTFTCFEEIFKENPAYPVEDLGGQIGYYMDRQTPFLFIREGGVRGIRLTVGGGNHGNFGIHTAICGIMHGCSISPAGSDAVVGRFSGIFEQRVLFPSSDGVGGRLDLHFLGLTKDIVAKMRATGAYCFSLAGCWPMAILDPYWKLLAGDQGILGSHDRAALRMILTAKTGYYTIRSNFRCGRQYCCA